MKRNIKFRGKRKDNGEWVYGSLVNNIFYYSKDQTPVYEILTGAGDCDCWEDIVEDENLLCEVIPESVGQFTGLLDKNGVEIYEDDFITCETIGWSFPNKGFVEFLNCHFCINVGEDYMKDEKTFLYTHFYNNENIKVIGNLTDNPELLK